VEGGSVSPLDSAVFPHTRLGEEIGAAPKRLRYNDLKTPQTTAAAVEEAPTAVVAEGFTADDEVQVVRIQAAARGRLARKQVNAKKEEMAAAASTEGAEAPAEPAPAEAAPAEEAA